MSEHTKADTARYLDAMVRLTAPDGRGPNHGIRRDFVNRFYTASDSNHFDGGGFFSWGGGNHFVDLVQGPGYLTITGYRVLMDRQALLAGPTPFNPNLMVTDVGKQLVRVAERPDLLTLWAAATAAPPTSSDTTEGPTILGRPVTPLRPTGKETHRAPMFLDVHGVAARYGVNEDTARRWCRTHRLPSVKIGGEYFVKLDKLNEIEGEASGNSGNQT